MITEKEFNGTCQMYGLVPANDLGMAFTFPGFENYVWAKYSPNTKEVYCWNKDWGLYNCGTCGSPLLRPASSRNDAPYSNVEEFHKEMDLMVRNFKTMNKKIRLKKIEELLDEL